MQAKVKNVEDSSDDVDESDDDDDDADTEEETDDSEEEDEETPKKVIALPLSTPLLFDVGVFQMPLLLLYCYHNPTITAK